LTLRTTIRPIASADLDAIYSQTFDQWGQAQARAYLEALQHLINLFADHPDIARERTEIQPPVRLHPFRSHLVIFRADAEVLEILRVIHAR
jgi:toxin ParE1/3/4